MIIEYTIIIFVTGRLASQARQDSPQGASQARRDSPQEASQARQNSTHWKPRKLGKTVLLGASQARQGNAASQARRVHMAPTWQATRAKHGIHVLSTWRKRPALPFYIDFHLLEVLEWFKHSAEAAQGRATTAK